MCSQGVGHCWTCTTMHNGHSTVTQLLFSDRRIISFIPTAGGWLNENEFKSWLLQCAKDFTHPTTTDLTAEELIDLVSSVDKPCDCQTCNTVRSFMNDPQKLVILVSCSRHGRHHVYRCIAEHDDHYHKENHGQGIMIKKMPEHPHSKGFSNYYEVAGRQGWLAANLVAHWNGTSTDKSTQKFHHHVHFLLLIAWMLLAHVSLCSLFPDFLQW